MELPHVYILTWCKRIELLYGTTMVFKTLRAGFPNARVHVVDAGSVHPGREAIRKSAEACGAEFFQLDRRMELSPFIERAMTIQRSGPAVFVDPDICFWESVENWQFDGLAAGRFIPRHHCEFADCPSEPRLHTSLMWVPSVAAMNAAIAEVRQTHRYFMPFSNIVVRFGDQWRFFDGGACLYSVYPRRMQAFEERHLNAYDHLFAGTYPDSVMARLGPDTAALYDEIHRTAQGDFRRLRGCWRRQEQYFQSRRIPDDTDHSSAVAPESA
jgi:hypothetical protein